MSDQEHAVTMYPSGTGLYNASCSCGWRAVGSTPYLIGRHGRYESQGGDSRKHETHDESNLGPEV